LYIPVFDGLYNNEFTIHGFCQYDVLSLELLSNLVSLLGISLLKTGLDNTRSIVLENNLVTTINNPFLALVCSIL
jgi:hypothetical protein